MKYAILSDIHSNAQALEAVVNACLKEKVQAFLCVGDIVGYGAAPSRCVNALQRLKAISVAGNHDMAVIGRLDASYFTDEGKEAIFWTRSNISFEDINYLNGLKLVYKNNDLILVHANLKDPLRFDYIRDIAKSEETFDLMDKQVCFVGHTHAPAIFIKKNDKIYKSYDTEIELTAGDKYIVNVGSVGQPRDRNPMASYCIYDTFLQMLEIRRTHYDIASAQNEILKAGLPKILAERLLQKQNEKEI